MRYLQTVIGPGLCGACDTYADPIYELIEARTDEVIWRRCWFCARKEEL